MQLTDGKLFSEQVIVRRKWPFSLQLARQVCLFTQPANDREKELSCSFLLLQSTHSQDRGNRQQSLALACDFLSVQKHRMEATHG